MSDFNGSSEAFDKQKRILAGRECQHCLVQHGSYKHYLGKEYYYDFDNGEVESNGRSCHMRGRLLALFPFGQIPHQDLEAIPQESAKLLKWGEDLGLISKSDPKSWKRIVKAEPEYMTVLFCAGIPLVSAKLEIITNFTLYLLDDIFDNFHFQQRDCPLPFNEVLADIQILEAYLLEEDERKLPAIDPTDTTHALCKLVPFARAMRTMRKIAQESGVNPRHFFESLADYMRHCALETHEMFYTAEELEYAYTKVHCQAISATLEAIFIVNRLEIPDQIRSDPMFSLLCHLSAVHAGLANDLFSLKKELLLGETKNTVLVRTHAFARRGLTFQDAFDSVLEETSAIAKRIIHLKDKIHQRFPNNNLVHKSVLVAMNYANAHLNYYIGTERYLNNETYFQFKSE